MAGRHGAGELDESPTSYRQEEMICHVEQNMSKGDLKAHPHSDTFPPTRPHLLQQGHTP